MIIGMDFGTTNTGGATFDGAGVKLLPLDPASRTPAVCRTAIYMTRGRDYLLGSQAVNLYFEQNVGRPTHFRKIWVGEIEQVFAELPTFYRDVFVYEDEFSPGRLFLSIKTALRNPNYYGTVFLDHWYSPSDLVAIFLYGMKVRAEEHLGAALNEVVLGRPVHFAGDETGDKIAQSRLLEAAFKAGFERVHLEYEPVAAALSYEKSIQDKEIVLVFDFGGGTLDFTIMELGDPRSRKVLATGGVPVAGDIFDQRLFRISIPRHLGEGDEFIASGSLYPIPAHIFDSLSQPQEVLALNTPQNLAMLRSIHQGSRNKRKTEALLKVISSNYALLMFDLVEQAKRRLSRREETSLAIEIEDFWMRENVTRARFEQAIAGEAAAIQTALQQVLDQAGMRPRDIDRVIRTGGSSQIPLFSRMLNDLFGAEKVRAIDVFSSVTSGLAIRAHEIETGEDVASAYTPNSGHGAAEKTVHESNPAGQPETEDPEGSPAARTFPVELTTVFKRLETSHEYRTGHLSLPEYVLLLLDEEDLFMFPALSIPALYAGQGGQDLLQRLAGRLHLGVQVCLARLQDQVLLATDRFKLIAADLKELWITQMSSKTGVMAALQLEGDERVRTIAPWQPDHSPTEKLCLITNTGQGRSFDARLMGDHIARRPYFQLERRYTGLPVSLLVAHPGDQLVVGTDSGRVGAASAGQMSVVVHDLTKVRKEELVTAAGRIPPQENILGFSSRGQAIIFSTGSIATDGPPAARGRTLRRNFHFTAIMPAGVVQMDGVFGLSDHGHLYPLEITNPQSGFDTPFQAFGLAKKERLVAVLES